MILVKKLLFAPLFLITFALLISQLSPIFKSSDFIFSLSINNLFQLIIISILLSLSSFLFIIFATLSFDLRLILPVNLLISVIPMFFLDQAIGVVLAVAVFISLLVSYLSLENTLKTYLNFQPTILFGPSFRRLSSFLILVISITYFLASSSIIAQNGFQIPDSIIDTTLKFTPQSETTTKIPQELVDNLIKQTVKDQIQSFIKPYLNFIPAILGLLLFVTFQSLTSIINLLIYPLLWITFNILEKTGYVKFTTEMRPVKKMVI
ncbi:hypothetical protein HYW41_00280 [Candidatus Daviesbacteria bacterium]|nr:hypothetical protein [Candidatus Daviesbacteria bacterium]